jgi:hypothetical protein
MIFSILLLLLMAFLGLTFLVGLILLLIGRLKKDRKNDFTEVGIVLAGIPAGIVALLFLLSLLGELFSSKPDEDDLVGKFHLVEVSGLSFDESTFNNYTLEFYKNGKFSMSNTPYIELCKSGDYNVNYSSNYNELSLHCPKKGYYSAHIVREFGSYKIEFVIGDPDRGNSLFFQKTKQ